MTDKLILVGYGIFLAFGAYFGWRAGSQISLVTGLISSALVFLGIFLLGGHGKVGYILLTAVSGLLSLVFIIRFFKTHAFMPSGLLLLVSAAIFVLCLSRFISNQ